MTIRSNIVVATAGLALAAAAPVSAATLTTLASFNTANGASPRGGLVFDASGNMYGTTGSGGASGLGTVYRIAAGTSTITTLVSFNGTNGSSPIAGLTINASGNLFGTAYTGGTTGGYGTVYRISAGTGTITTLASFNGTNGANPWGGVVLDSSGNLYGTTIAGGAAGTGTVFRISAGANTPTTLATFSTTNGANPYGSLVADASGNLYGTTTNGGSGYGTVFRIAAGTGTITTLATFNNINGANPYGQLTVDANGNLYGTTSGGGSGYGTVFRITAGTGTITTLVSFPFGGANGYVPYSGLIIDEAGNLFGTAYSGGASGYGTVFRVDAGTNALVTLASFAGGTEGRGPYDYSGLAVDANGNLYGTTWRGGTSNVGTVFKVSDTGFVTASVAAVPEPATWATMLIGFGMVGGSHRHRRRRTTVRYA